MLNKSNQQMLESCARMDVYFEQIMTGLAQTSPKPLVPISNQTQESHPINQVNQILMPQDSTPHFDKPSESVPPSFHLSQFEEFESKNHF
jgi:hypothetical protein